MKEQVLMQAKGATGTIELLPDRIRITRAGIFSSLYDRRSRTELLLQQIKSIEFKQTIGGLGGYLMFHDNEGNEVYEDYLVSFVKAQYQSFRALHEALQERTEAIRKSHEATKMDLLKL